jgi:hypothetical protein
MLSLLRALGPGLGLGMGVLLEKRDDQRGDLAGGELVQVARSAAVNEFRCGTRRA